MKVSTIPIPSSVNGKSEEIEVFVVEITGRPDPSSRIITRARELVTRTGSASMMDSFDWALRADLDNAR